MQLGDDHRVMNGSGANGTDMLDVVYASGGVVTTPW